MKIFIDTNILLDVLTAREPFYENSAVIWSLAEKRQAKGYISAISVNNIYYITKKMIGMDEAESIVDKVLNDFTVLPLTFEVLKLARTISKKDFEDIIQYFSAIQIGCDYIVTRNKRTSPKKK